jgi:hypothetical protein
MTAAVIASVVGIGAGAAGLYKDFSGGGGGGGGGSSSTSYVPTDLSGADQSWQQIMQQMAPYLQQNAGNLNTGIIAGYGSTQPGGMYGGNQQAALNSANTSDYLAASNMNQIPYLQSQGQQIMNNAMDPQTALYNQYAQQVQDQANANTSMRGIGMGAEAAGIANQAGSNFMNQWQNQQLARQVQGAGALNQLYGQAGNYGSAAGQDITGYLNMLNMGAQMPATYGTSYGGAEQAGVYNPGLSQQQQYLNYLNVGNNAGQNAFNQGQTNLGNLTSGLGGLANVYQQSNNQNQDFNSLSGANYGDGPP